MKGRKRIDKQLEDMDMPIIMRGKGIVLIGLLACWVSLFFMGSSLAEDKPEAPPCPKPYIKLIKPKLAKTGQPIIIRGHRFGKEEQGCEVIFEPGLNARVISWENSRIEVEVPSGAKTGKVVVKTKCAESIGEFFKVAE